MLVLISPEKDISNEIAFLHQLFDEGLQYYHLRKPEKSESEFKAYLHQINESYYRHIVVHQYHHLAKEFGLKGIHLQEQFRIDLRCNLQQYVDSFKATNNFTVSSSFHHPDVLEECNVVFDYHLLSPVFSSISKKGYNGKEFSVNHINKTIIGMGGVTYNNLSEIKSKGYVGAGVLGGVWNQDDKVLAFKKLLQNSRF